MSIIDELELSAWTSNILRETGQISSLEDFLAIEQDWFLARPNAGRKSWNELKQLQDNFHLEAVFQKDLREAEFHLGELNHFFSVYPETALRFRGGNWRLLKEI